MKHLSTVSTLTFFLLRVFSSEGISNFGPELTIATLVMSVRTFYSSTNNLCTFLITVGISELSSMMLSANSRLRLILP